MTGTGLRSLGIILTALFVGVAASVGGCANVSPFTPIAVSDIKAVTGTWKGLVYLSSQVSPDSVTLTIREDGSYDVVTAQQLMGTTRGRGKIVISEGRLIFEGERGRGMGRVLKDSAGSLTMEVDATLSDNTSLTAKLARSN